MTEVKLKESIDITIPVKNNRPRKERLPKGWVKVKVNQPKLPTEDELKIALERCGGKYVEFPGNVRGLLIAGASVSVAEPDFMNKYRFVIVDNNRQVVLVDSGEHFTVLRDVPADLYVLDYLYHREAADLYAKVEAQFSDEFKVLTKTYFYIPTKKNVNKTKKNNKKVVKK